MKRFILLGIFCCAVMLLPAQSVMQYPFIGHLVSEFKDSILCKDAYHLDKTYAEYPACKSFLVTAPSTVYRYGETEFNAVFLFPDDSGKVMSISYQKIYLKENKGSSVKEDEAALKNYFSSLYGAPEKTTVKTDYADDRTSTWKKEGIKITLMVNTIKKRKNVKLRYILQLGIDKVEKQ